MPWTPLAHRVMVGCSNISTDGSGLLAEETLVVSALEHPAHRRWHTGWKLVAHRALVGCDGVGLCRCCLVVAVSGAGPPL